MTLEAQADDIPSVPSQDKVVAEAAVSSETLDLDFIIIADNLYSCGEEGHNKAECPNPRVDRLFDG